MYEKQEALVAKTPVSTTMKCIIFLTFQFFLVYTTLFIVQMVGSSRRNRSPGEVGGQTPLLRLEQCLKCVVEKQYLIPMLCVLFLATRMRAVQLSQGMTERYELPQWWVKRAMITSTLAVMLQTVLAAVYYALLNKDPGGVKGGNLTAIEKALNAARYLLILCLCCGFIIVCIGVCIMPAPEEIWGEDGGPKVSPAVTCTIFLTSLYFVVHFCIEVVKTLDEVLTPQGQRFGVFESQNRFLREVSASVDIAPMLCILFIAARLRALQLDPLNGSPQRWAQTWFYVASLSLLGLVMMGAIITLFMRKEARAQQPLTPPGGAGPQQADPGSPEGPIVVRPSTRVRAAEAVSAVFLLFLLMAAFAVIFSMFTLTRKDGPTPVMPPSIKCVMILTMVYFGVYFFQWLTAALKKVSLRMAKNQGIANLSNFVEKHAKEAMVLSPMLCVLLMGTFMRALQITNGKGAPQRWAQLCMYVATMSIVIMTVARMDELLYTPSGADGSTSKPAPIRFQMFCRALDSLCLLFVHIAVVAIIIALFTMTPQTARGVGAIVNLSAASSII